MIPPGDAALTSVQLLERSLRVGGGFLCTVFSAQFSLQFSLHSFLCTAIASLTLCWAPQNPKLWGCFLADYPRVGWHPSFPQLGWSSVGPELCPLVLRSLGLTVLIMLCIFVKDAEGCWHPSNSILQHWQNWKSEAFFPQLFWVQCNLKLKYYTAYESKACPLDSHTALRAQSEGPCDIDFNIIILQKVKQI